MLLVFFPVRMDSDLTIHVAGEVLTLNETVLDLAALPPGGVLAQGDIDCAWIAGDVSRDADGLLTVPVILPHGPDAPAARRFPAPLLVTADGPVALAPFDAPPEAAPEP
jgi:hypothetical protein